MDAPLRDKTSAEPGAHARPFPAQVLRPRQRGEQEAGAQRAERRFWRGRTASLRPEGACLQGELAARHAPGAGTRLRGVVPREVGVREGRVVERAEGGPYRSGGLGTDRRGSGTGTCLPSTDVWTQVCSLPLQTGLEQGCGRGMPAWAHMCEGKQASITHGCFRQQCLARASQKAWGRPC